MFLQGFLLSLVAYFIWGIAPIFWKQVTHIPADVLLYHRVFFAFLILFLALLPKWKKHLLSLKDNFRFFFLTSAIIGVNWYIFVWAILNNRILETSLGYYLNPFVNLVVGYFFLKESLNRKQSISVSIAFVGVIFIAVAIGNLPWISVILALSFSAYGYLHKQISMRADASLFIETALLLPFFLYFNFSNPDIFEIYQQGNNLVWLFLGGVITVVPLLCFIQGVKHIPLSLTGILQFLAPTMTFLTAIFVYKENFSYLQLVGFLFIWISVSVYLYEAFKKRKKAHQD